MDELLKHAMDDIHIISSRDELCQGKHQMSQQNNDVAYRLHSGGKLALSRYRKVEGEDEYVGKRVMAMEVPGIEGEEDQSGGGWIASGTNCPGRTRKTGLKGGVS